MTKKAQISQLDEVKNKPHVDTIEELEIFLEQAKLGELTGFSGIFYLNDGTYAKYTNIGWGEKPSSVFAHLMDLTLSFRED